MNFAHPDIFLFLWIIVPLVLIVYRGISRRKKILTGFATGEGLVRLAGESSSSRRLSGAILLILAAALMLIALGGPRYGYRWEKIEQKGVDIVVALDCSRSMLAEDIKPTRLTRAKYEIIDLLRMLTGDRIGLVAFSGSAFLQCPLTMDYSAFNLFLDTLSPDMLPVGGTNLGDAIRTAVSGFNNDDDSDKAVILITDGEQTTGSDPIEAARMAAEKNIKLFCIGVGEDQGAPVPEDAGGFKKDRDGKIVLTRLDEETLKQMAAVTGGLHVRSVSGDMDLETIYQDRIRGTMDQTTLQSGKKKIWEDRFQWFLALALLCLVIEMFLPKGRGAVALLFFLMIGAGVTDARAESVYNDVEQGRTAYDEQQYEKALKHFIDAQLADPENAELYYNVGSAYYKAGHFVEAADNYKKALELIPDDDQRKENVWYNLGNACFRQQDFENAIDAYQQALAIKAEDREAAENLELAKKAAEEQKKQQEQQNQCQDKQQQGEDKEQQSQGDSGDQSRGKQDQKPSSGNEDKQMNGQQNQNSQEQGTEEREQEQQQEQGQEQPQAASLQPDQGESRLNRLQDKPGAAMMIPDYRKKEVEQDW